MFANYLFETFSFIFGLCIGSFLNCVIYRTELQENMPAGPDRRTVSFLRGKSFCPHCKHTLFWQDLFPVFSFLFLKGKCRYCKKSISWQYPFVELTTGLLFLLIFNFKFSIFNEFSILNFLNLAFLFYIACVLIIIFIYDLKHYLIPDKILFPAIILTFFYKFFINLSFSNWDLIENLKLKIGNSASISNFILAAVIASGFFFIIWIVSGGRWMGFGDVKLAVLMGFLLGMPNVLLALFLAFFFGAIIGIMLIVFPFGSVHGGKKKSLKSEIPFGPFLIAGTLISLLWGVQLISWYMGYFNF
jgi:leader peptidase (prepilin peptidase) / N-methyltransferase